MKLLMNKKGNYKYITYPKFVFLCGKSYKDNYDYSNRGVVEKYFMSNTDNVFIVLSEKMWEDKFSANIDLLTFEEFLAEVSDAIILFVESPGSYCELGAFAYDNKLFSDKLMIIIDEKYKTEKSFIMTGPTAKARNNGAKVIYAKLEDVGLLSSAELRYALNEKLQEFTAKKGTNKMVYTTSSEYVYLKSFIIELLELIKILQPISKDELIGIYKKLKGFTSFNFIKRDNTRFNREIKYDYIIRLLDIVKLIELNGDIITMNNEQKMQSFMFKNSPREIDRIRNKIICKKYRYKG